MTSVPVAAPARGFADLGVPSPVVRALADGGVEQPFPIQTATLPDSLAGRDVLGRGRTGSGKTIAFAIPVVARLAAARIKRAPYRPRALVLVPTRELANQVATVVKPLAESLGLKTATIFGGVSQHPQVVALKTGVDVVIACPGRLEDLITQGFCHLDAVEISVLDEADHMADLGFLPGVKRLLDRTPEDTQCLLFSATLDNGVDVLVQRYMREPVTHSVDPEVAPVDTMTHHVFAIEPADKLNVVRELVVAHPRTILFTRTKHGAKKLTRQLSSAQVPTVELHGNLSQNARERNLAAFASGEAWALIATDIAARGIHVDDIRLVVHVDPPAEHKAYLHRSGRTARAGAEGAVVTLALPEQVSEVAILARDAAIQPTLTAVRPGSSVIRTLPGDDAELLPIQPKHTPGRRAQAAASANRKAAATAGTSAAAASTSPAPSVTPTGDAAARAAQRPGAGGATRDGAPGAARRRRNRRGPGAAGRSASSAGPASASAGQGRPAAAAAGARRSQSTRSSGGGAPSTQRSRSDGSGTPNGARSSSGRSGQRSRRG